MLNGHCTAAYRALNDLRRINAERCCVLPSTLDKLRTAASSAQRCLSGRQDLMKVLLLSSSWPDNSNNDTDNDTSIRLIVH
jgi:hypothetical protein